MITRMITKLNEGIRKWQNAEMSGYNIIGFNKLLMLKKEVLCQHYLIEINVLQCIL